MGSLCSRREVPDTDVSLTAIDQLYHSTPGSVGGLGAVRSGRSVNGTGNNSYILLLLNRKTFRAFTGLILEGDSVSEVVSISIIRWKYEKYSPKHDSSNLLVRRGTVFVDI
jgi:hypothetical protein